MALSRTMEVERRRWTSQWEISPLIGAVMKFARSAATVVPVDFGCSAAGGDPTFGTMMQVRAVPCICMAVGVPNPATTVDGLKAVLNRVGLERTICGSKRGES